MSDFYRRLDEKEQPGRIDRLFANRPDSLHDYQGCANDEARKHAVPAPPASPTIDCVYCPFGPIGLTIKCDHCGRGGASPEAEKVIIDPIVKLYQDPNNPDCWSEIPFTSSAHPLPSEDAVASYRAGFLDCRDKAMQIVDEHDGFLNRIEALEPTFEGILIAPGNTTAPADDK